MRCHFHGLASFLASRIRGRRPGCSPVCATACLCVVCQHLPTLVKLDDIGPNGWANIDVVFCCLPHATTQEIIKGLPKTVKVRTWPADGPLAPSAAGSPCLY